jgi:hypothetical protein
MDSQFQDLPAPVPAPVGPRFAVQPHVTEGGFGAGPAVLLMLAMAAAGVVVGFVAHFIGQWLYLIVLFPILMGLVVGSVGAREARVLKIRNATLGIVVAALSGLVAVVGMHYFDFLQARGAMEKLDPEVRATLDLSPAAFEEYMRRKGGLPSGAWALYKLYHADTFGKFMGFEAEQGMEVKPTHSSSKQGGMNLGYVGTCAYWVIELALVWWMAWARIRAQVTMPFCGRCQAWKAESVLGSLGQAHADAAKAVMSGDMDLLRRCRSAYAPVRNRATETALSIYACPQCAPQAEVAVRVQGIQKDGKKTKVRQLAFATYPGEALPHLKQLFQAPPPAVEDIQAPPAEQP